MVQTVVVLICMIVIVCILLALTALLPARARAKDAALTLRDSTQVRQIHQAMVTWSGDDRGGRYPLPSLVDIHNTTVAEEGERKDTTANIYSLMVFNNLITPDILVSPREINPKIRVHKEYEFDQPRFARTPEEALWDPGFSADFTSSGCGNVSYAHLLPLGPRGIGWRNTMNSAVPALGMRGPKISVAQSPRGVFGPPQADPDSLTLRIHRPRDSWQGNIVFGDNSVRFVTGLTAEGVTYSVPGPHEAPDLLHFDEPDDLSRTNAFLGIFTTADPNREDVRAIWD